MLVVRLVAGRVDRLSISRSLRASEILISLEGWARFHSTVPFTRLSAGPVGIRRSFNFVADYSVVLQFVRVDGLGA